MKITELAKILSTNISQGRAHFDVAVFQPPEGHGCTLVSEVLVRDEAQVIEIYCGTQPKRLFSWQRKEGYECSSKGDKRFSALFATMPDGRTIEQWYQCDIKGYDIAHAYSIGLAVPFAVFEVIVAFVFAAQPSRQCTLGC